MASFVFCDATRNAYGLGLDEALRLADDLWATTLARHDEASRQLGAQALQRSNDLLDALFAFERARRTLRDDAEAMRLTARTEVRL